MEGGGEKFHIIAESRQEVRVGRKEVGGRGKRERGRLIIYPGKDGLPACRRLIFTQQDRKSDSEPVLKFI